MHHALVHATELRCLQSEDVRLGPVCSGLVATLTIRRQRPGVYWIERSFASPNITELYGQIQILLSDLWIDENIGLQMIHNQNIPSTEWTDGSSMAMQQKCKKDLLAFVMQRDV